jgi:hypothetical protein
MNFKTWFKCFKKQPEPQPDDFNQQFDAWLAGKLFKGSEEVYTLAVKGNRGIAVIEGTFEFHQEWKQAEARRVELQSGNPGVKIEIRKITFDYKYI